MGAFSFMSDPVGDAFTPSQFMEQAYDQPFAKTDAFLAAGTEAVLGTADLGVAARNLTVPEGRVNTLEKTMLNRTPAGVMLEPYVRKPLDWLLGSTGRETDAQLAARGEQPLTAEQYKASPSYRERVPYDDAMTVNRANVLAQYDDARSVREEMARKAPWWVNTSGSLIGGALSPTNYIPVFGEAAAGASLGARILRGGADAAANVGVAGLLSAPARAQYGDDVSFQSQVSSIAMAAAIGGVFGGVGGILHSRAAANDARAAATQKDLASRLATIRNGQDSMATLAEAVDHLSNDGEINLGEGSIDRMQGLNDQAFGQRWPDALHPEDEYSTTGYHGSTHVFNEFDPERAGTNPGLYFSSTPDLANRFADLTANDGDPAVLLHDHTRDEYLSHMKEALSDREYRDVQAKYDEYFKLEQELKDAGGGTYDEPTPRMQELAKELNNTSRRTASMLDQNEKFSSDGGKPNVTPVRLRLGKTYEVTKDGAFSYEEEAAAIKHAEDNGFDSVTLHLTGKGKDSTIYIVPKAENVRHELAFHQAPPRAVLSTRPRPETVQPEAIKAAKEVGKPDTAKQIAEQHGVDGETGAIPEDYELAQLAKEGRLEPGSVDAKAMEAANENFATAKSWGEALRAAVACLI